MIETQTATSHNVVPQKTAQNVSVSEQKTPIIFEPHNDSIAYHQTSTADDLFFIHHSSNAESKDESHSADIVHHLDEDIHKALWEKYPDPRTPTHTQDVVHQTRHTYSLFQNVLEGANGERDSAGLPISDALIKRAFSERALAMGYGGVRHSMYYQPQPSIKFPQYDEQLFDKPESSLSSFGSEETYQPSGGVQMSSILAPHLDPHMQCDERLQNISDFSNDDFEAYDHQPLPQIKVTLAPKTLTFHIHAEDKALKDYAKKHPADSFIQTVRNYNNTLTNGERPYRENAGIRVVKKVLKKSDLKAISTQPTKRRRKVLQNAVS